MKRVFISLLCLVTAMAATPGYAADSPTFHKYVFSDNAIVIGMSDNGKWALVHAGMSDAKQSTKARLVEVDTDAAIELQTQAEIERQGTCTVNDVTDDGNIVAGAIEGMPAYWTKSAKTWTKLPIPSGCGGGSVYAITPDGKYAVGSGVYANDAYKEKGVMWDIATGKIVELTNIPAKDMSHNDMQQQRFTAVTPDGRYVLASMSFSYMQPLGLCSYLYDTRNQTYKFIGFTPSDTGAWTPAVHGLRYVDMPMMSPNGKWVAATGLLMTQQGESYITLRYNVETGETEAYSNSMEDRDVIPGAIDNDGTVYGCTPGTTSPIREWSVRYGKYWYAIRDILTQKYGIDFAGRTGYDNTGTPYKVSADGTKIAVMVNPSGDSYLVELPEPAVNICAAINLLDNYTVTPASGSTFSRLKTAQVTFDRNVSILGEAPRIEVRDGDGTVVATSSAIKVNTNDPKTIDIPFLRAATFAEGKKYTLEIPAGSVCIDGDGTKTNEAITITYNGRADKPVAAVSIYPADNSELAKIDNSSNPVIITFDTEVAVAETASARLVRNSDGKEMASMLLLASGDRVAVYPASVQYLFKGQTYKVVVDAGAVTDVTGSGASGEITVNYTGTYERTISSDDATLFFDDFSNPTQSYNNFMRYEGDHNTPVSAMSAWEFDADNNPWNFTIRDNESSTGYSAASHSMYTPAGKSDDWMVIPQITVPDEFCVLSFDAQSYRANKKDRLKVLVWQNDEVVNELTAGIVARMKAEAEVVFDEQLSPGLSEEELDDDWTHYSVDLAKYGGKSVYIAFLNDNEDQSAVFVDSILVKRNMKYLMSLTNEASVVEKESINIAGKVTANSDTDTFGTIALTLFDSEGREVDHKSENGLALKKGDTYEFAFAKPLALTKGEINGFSIGIQLDNYQDVVKSSVKSLAFEPKKRVVVEEVTGITCPNCPLGILAIENLEKNFGGQVIPISIHTYTGDPFGAGLSGYSEFLGLNAAPTAMINRSGDVSSPMMSYRGNYMFSNGLDLWYDRVNKELQTPADADIEASVEVDEKANTFSIPVKVRYALNAKSLSLNLFFVVMEDGIVSSQDNNLGGQSDPDLGEWGQGGKYSASTVYNVTHNDVVRTCLSSYNGIGGYLPQTMTAGTEYTATLENIAIPENITDLNKAKVAVMLIDANTDQIVNSVCALFPGYAAGVPDATTDAADCRIHAENGRVSVTATGDTSVSLYSTAGTLLGTADGNGSVTLSAGGWQGTAIVKVVCGSGTMTRKIIVR